MLKWLIRVIDRLINWLWKPDSYLDTADPVDVWVSTVIQQLRKPTQDFLKDHCAVTFMFNPEGSPSLLLSSRSETDFDEANGLEDIQDISLRFWRAARVQHILIVEPGRILKATRLNEENWALWNCPKEASE